MLRRVDRILNGSIYIDFYVYGCERCKCELAESDSMSWHDGSSYCPDCAFIAGLISEDECKNLGYSWIGMNFCLEVIDGEVVALDVCRASSVKDRRTSVDYAEWRTSVYERDNYTCRKCNTVGGKLNAHHIKPYSKFPHLRIEKDNGITLCEPCHKAVHARKVQ